MPERLYPGIHVEEVGPGPAPINGVPTATAAFLGQTERGPTAPTAVTSLAEYRSVFGGAFADAGYMVHAVAGFFENGGRRAVIARIVPAAPGAITAADFEGFATGEDPATGLAALDLEEHAEVALVHAPDANAVPDLIPRLIAHCERARYRFAVLDTPAGIDDPVAPADTSYAACYHPWIEVADPQSGARRLVPPGGHVLGVYSRVDAERGVFKAPADEVVRGATGLAVDITTRRQEALNAAGVNVIRRFAGRGVRVWGARSLSSDPAWKYVNIRRFFIYLERSIDGGIRWVVFEPNDERLWARVQDTIRLFLRAQWRSGGLMGTTEDKAFFVRCDRTTMSQDDLDNGRLVCLIGVAPIRPAEFVVFRIGQWTADRRP